MAARHHLHRFLGNKEELPPHVKELGVRINPVSNGHFFKELAAIMHLPKQFQTIVVPKVHRAADIHLVSEVMKSLRPDRRPSKILALIETAEAVMNLSEICKASPFVHGLIFGAEDFALDLSMARTPSLTEFLYARSAIVTAAKAFNIPSVIDLVCTRYGDNEADVEALQQECADGRILGFNGKQCIHPSQIATVEKAFSSSHEELEWAIRVDVESERASNDGQGAFTMDGKMIDAPVVGKAKALIEKAKRCGLDTHTVRNSLEDQSTEAVENMVPKNYDSEKKP